MAHVAAIRQDVAAAGGSFPRPKQSIGSTAVATLDWRYANADLLPASHDPIEWAKAGYGAFPCRRKGKNPAIPTHEGGQGYLDATTDLDQILAWQKQFPGCNWGSVPGVNGCVVLDFDPRTATEEGHALARSLRHTTATVLTPTPDGEHFWFALPDGVTLDNKPGNLPAGFDVRAHNGYVLLPGSVVTYYGDAAAKKGVKHGFTGTYRIGNAGPIAPLPDSLLRLILTGQSEYKRTEAGPPNVEAVQGSIMLVEKVLALANVQREAWREHDGTGRKAILVNCPFNPEDDPHEQDSGAAVLIGADGRIGAVCHHARCQERIKAAGGNGWALLKQIAGYKPGPTVEDKAHARVVVEALREWIRRADFAEHVPVVLQACNGYRTNGTDKAVADAILQVAHEMGRVTDLPLSRRSLRRRSGGGSVATAHYALARLTDWFIVKDADSGSYSIHPDLLKAVDTSCVDRTPYYREREDAPNGEGCSIYATSPLTTHRAHDALTSSQSPITEAQLRARIEARELEIVDAAASGIEPPPPIERKRYRRRLAADIPSAGRNVQLIMDALYTDGPTLSRADLRDLLSMSASALSRAVKRAAWLGLVDAARHTVTLREDWLEHLDVITPAMPTAGRGLRLEIADLDATIRFCLRRMGMADCTPEEKVKLEKRRQWAIWRKSRIAHAEGAEVTTSAMPAPVVKADAVAERIARLRELVAHGEHAEQRAAVAETPTPAILRQLRMAGYTDADIADDILRGGNLVRTIRSEGLQDVRGWNMPTIHFEAQLVPA